MNNDFEKFLIRNPNKKIVCIYGNCHTMVISEMLESESDFLDKFAIYKIPPIQNIKDSTFFEGECFKKCDVFIHQSIQRNNKYGEAYSSENIIKKLSPTCKVIAIPNVFHMPTFLFPQCDYSKKTFQWRKGNVLFFRDKIIDELLLNGKKLEEIYDFYSNGKIDSDEELIKQYESFKNKLKLRELEWDIKVSDFIEANIKKNKLFYDPSHPTNFYLGYITSRIVDTLLCKPVETNEINYDQVYKSVTRLDLTELPILNRVKSFYGLEYDNTYLRESRHGKKIIDEEVDTRNYIKQYMLLSWQNDELGLLVRTKLFFAFIILKVKDRLLRCIKGVRPR